MVHFWNTAVIIKTIQTMLGKNWEDTLQILLRFCNLSFLPGVLGNHVSTFQKFLQGQFRFFSTGPKSTMHNVERETTKVMKWRIILNLEFYHKVFIFIFKNFIFTVRPSIEIWYKHSDLNSFAIPTKWFNM